MIQAIQKGLKEEGFEVSVAQLCRWFDVPRRSVYYRPVKKSAPKVQERFVQPVKDLIEENPSFGYRGMKSNRTKTYAKVLLGFICFRITIHRT